MLTAPGLRCIPTRTSTNPWVKLIPVMKKARAIAVIAAPDRTACPARAAGLKPAIRSLVGASAELEIDDDHQDRQGSRQKPAVLAGGRSPSAGMDRCTEEASA